MNTVIRNVNKKGTGNNFLKRAVRAAMRRVRILGTFGFRFACPFCGWHARLFYARGLLYPVLADMQVVGAGRRRNAVCPRCYSNERERLMYLYLKRQGWFHAQNRRILHVAAENNLCRALRAQYGAGYVNTAYNNPQKSQIHADVRALPFSDVSFDLIICSHVLEHVDDDARAMRELYRVLKPGGLAILQVPFSPLLKKTLEDKSIVSSEQRAAAFGQEDHVRLYGTDYVSRLRDAGFRVFELLPEQFLLPQEARRASLNPREPLFLSFR